MSSPQNAQFSFKKGTASFKSFVVIFFPTISLNQDLFCYELLFIDNKEDIEMKTFGCNCLYMSTAGSNLGSYANLYVATVKQNTIACYVQDTACHPWQ